MGKSRRHNWASYHVSQDKLEISIRDSSNAKIESWVINVDDKKRIKQVFSTIKSKYGINLFFSPIEKPKDLDWLPSH